MAAISGRSPPHLAVRHRLLFTANGMQLLVRQLCLPVCRQILDPTIVGRPTVWQHSCPPIPPYAGFGSVLLGIVPVHGEVCGLHSLLSRARFPRSQHRYHYLWQRRSFVFENLLIHRRSIRHLLCAELDPMASCVTSQARHHFVSFLIDDKRSLLPRCWRRSHICRPDSLVFEWAIRLLEALR